MLDSILRNINVILYILFVSCIVISLAYFLKSKQNRYILRFYISFILYKIGVKKRISGKYISGVRERECYEPLVDLVKHPKIIINDETVEHPILLRKNVAMKLYKVADTLPDNVCIKVYSAYRSRLALYGIWKEELERQSENHPDIGRAELLKRVNNKVANPNGNMGGHDTGAAIDLALCDGNGNELDFGSKYHDRYKGKNLTKEQKENCKMLKKAMKSQNFVNMPGQWWHFSYGDKTWAAYNGKRSQAVYTSAEKEFDKMGFVRIVKTEIKSVNIK